MTIIKLKLAAVALIGIGIVGTGTGVVAYRTLIADDKSAPAAGKVSDQAKDDLEKMQGTWSIIEVEQFEKRDKVPEGQTGMLIRIKGDEFTIDPEGEKGEKRVWTFKLDPRTKPKTIHMTMQAGPHKGKTAAMIYRFDGDNLTICGNNEPDGEQPREFATKAGSGLILMVLKREPAFDKNDPASKAKQKETVTKVSEAANRLRSANNLTQIGIAMHMYHNDQGRLPPDAVYGQNNKPLLSWRVLILPYLQQDALFRQFKLDEPWDSENNKKLLAQMPKFYAPPGANKKNEHNTFYRILVGKGAAFEEQSQLRLFDMTDGTSNTILLVEAGDGVPWTKPDELSYDAGKPLPKFGGLFKDGFHVLFADGSTHFVGRKADEQDLRAAITRGGGEHFEREKLSR